jgi:hypothetical protein
MLPSEFLTAVRGKLRDTKKPYLWSDQELLAEYGNKARNKLFLGVRKLIVDSTTAVDASVPPLPLCSLSLVANTHAGVTFASGVGSGFSGLVVNALIGQRITHKGSSRGTVVANTATTVTISDLTYTAPIFDAIISKWIYPVSPKIIEVVSIILSGQSRPLDVMTVAEMNTSVPHWRNVAAGIPSAVIIDLATDSLAFFPAPLVGYTALLSVCRFPLQRMALSAQGGANNSIPLDFREEYHDDLIAGVMAEAYTKDDTETKRPELALIYEKRFKDRIEEIKDELSRRVRTNHGNRIRRAYGS